MSEFVNVLLRSGDGGILLHVLTYLTVPEISRSLTTCKAAVCRSHQFTELQLHYLWQSVAHLSVPSLAILRTLRYQLHHLPERDSGKLSSEPDHKCPKLEKELSHYIYSMNVQKNLKWSRCHYQSSTCQRIGRMEGHAATTLNRDDGRWVVIVSGWGPQSINEIYIIDGLSIDIERCATAPNFPCLLIIILLVLFFFSTGKC
jgi:hypothetical protein